MNTELKKWLDEIFFKGIIDCYMLGDLENLIKIKAVNGCGGCNFPIVLYLFSCIEFLGGLISNDEIKDDATKEKIFTYIKLAFPETEKQAIVKFEKDFVNIFRHGLSHEFFAKSAGVTRDKVTLLSEYQGHLVIDADLFYEAFKTSVIKLKKLIEEGTITGDDVRRRYIDKYNKNLKFRVPEQSTSSNSGSFSTNATLPPSSITLPYKPEILKEKK